jgi:hypothetical protein
VNRVVLYRGTSLNSLHRVGVVAAAAGLHQPTVAYDGQRFLLWYTRDSIAGWAHELVFSSSQDGIHFTAATVKESPAAGMPPPERAGQEGHVPGAYSAPSQPGVSG